MVVPFNINFLHLEPEDIRISMNEFKKKLEEIGGLGAEIKSGHLAIYFDGDNATGTQAESIARLFEKYVAGIPFIAFFLPEASH